MFCFTSEEIKYDCGVMLEWSRPVCGWAVQRRDQADKRAYQVLTESFVKVLIDPRVGSLLRVHFTAIKSES